MKNIGTKSTNMSEIMVYLAMFIINIDKMKCVKGNFSLKGDPEKL